MGRSEKPLDRDGTPEKEFAFWLRDLRYQAQRTYGQLANEAKYGSTTLQSAVAGTALPSLELTLSFVRACGGDEGQWQAYWTQIRRALDPGAPDDVRLRIQPPWAPADAVGGVPRAAGSSRAAEPASDGWYCASCVAELRLDTDPIESREDRVAVAAVHGLAELDTSISVPRHRGDSSEGHGLDVELLHGGSLERREQPYESHFRNVIALPHPLRLGERHEYAMRLRLPSGQPLAPHYVQVPFRRTDYFEARVRFDPDRPPRAVWGLNGTPTSVLDEHGRAQDALIPDSSGAVKVVFHDLRVGLTYGIAWAYLPLISTRFRPAPDQLGGRQRPFTDCAGHHPAVRRRRPADADALDSIADHAAQRAGLSGGGLPTPRLPSPPPPVRPVRDQPGRTSMVGSDACRRGRQRSRGAPGDSPGSPGLSRDPAGRAPPGRAPPGRRGGALRRRTIGAMLGRMPVAPDTPTLEEIVIDLRVLRERGLVRLRHTDLARLAEAARNSSATTAAAGEPGDIEVLVRTAVDNLGGGPLGAAAGATFGLARGARDAPAQDRRRRAALAYGVSVERFRKHHERIVIEQVAEEILKLRTIQDRLQRTEVTAELGHQIRLVGALGDYSFPIIVHIEPVELLSNVDILVVSENIYLEPPQPFKASVSAAIRRAAAVRGADGEIVTDVIAEELRRWVLENGRTGLPVAAGTVAVTSAGAMASQGIGKIYHTAIVTPRPGTNEYLVEPTAIATGVRQILTLARADPALAERSLPSIAFPLLGTGRGALDPVLSFTWLWTAIERDIREYGPWELHFVTHRRTLADVMISQLRETAVVPPAYE